MKRKLVKQMALAVSAVLLTTAMMGCSSKEEVAEEPKEETTEESAEESSEPVTLSVMMQQSRVYPGLEKMIDKLEKEENIIFDMQVLPDDEFKNVLQMKLNSGEAPDLIDYNTNNFVDLDPDANLYDLSEQAWVKDLINPAVVTFNDKIYGFPFQERNGIGCMLYNMDVFEANNLEVPTNQEEFYAVCDKLKAAGVTPILEASDIWVPQMWMNYEFPKALGGEEELKAFGDAIVSGEKKVTDYPELAEVIDTYIDMYTKGYVNEDYLTAPYDKMIERLGKGEGAMVYGYTTVLAAVEKNFPDTKMGMFNLKVDAQAVDAMASPAFSISFMVSKDTENIEAISRVFELFATPEYGDLWFEGNVGFPAFEGINGGEQNESQMALYEEYLAKDAIVSELYTVIPELSPLNGTSFWPLINGAPGEGMTGMELLEQWQSDIEVYMKEQKAPGF